MSLTNESPSRALTRTGLAEPEIAVQPDEYPQDIAPLPERQARPSRQREILWSGEQGIALLTILRATPEEARAPTAAPQNLPLSVSVRRTEMGTTRAGPNPTRQSVKRKRLAQRTRPWEPPGNVPPRDDRVLHAHSKGPHKRAAVQARGGGCCRQADVPAQCIRGGGIGVVRQEREVTDV